MYSNANEMTGIDFNDTSVVKKLAESMLNAYKPRECALRLSLKCKLVIHHSLFRHLCMKFGSEWEVLSSTSHGRPYIYFEMRDSIDSLLLPVILKNYLKGDRGDEHDDWFPRPVYLLIEWFAEDEETRENWKVFVSKKLLRDQ